MHKLARKDFFYCLGIWLAIEIVCFAILPALRLVQTGKSTDLWFIASVWAGIGGALLMAWGTQLTLLGQGRPPKRAGSILIGFLSWVGLLGIAFPILFMSSQLFSKLFTQISQ